MRLTLVLWSCIATASSWPCTAAERLIFERDVLPILNSHCLQCHGGLHRKGELDLRTASAALAGGKSGKVVVRGDLDASLLWKKIAADEMPKSPIKVAAEHKEIIRRWIADGAKSLRSSGEITVLAKGKMPNWQVVDPLGFALEKFDNLGRERTKDETGQLIDDLGELPGVRTIAGVAGLREVLLKRKDEFARCLTEKLLTYALGRSVEEHDIPTIDAIVAALGKNDYRMQTLIFELVKSEPFRMRRGVSGDSR